MRVRPWRTRVTQGVDLGHLIEQWPIDRAVPRLVEFELLVERFLFQVRQQKDAPAVKRPALAVERGGGRQHAVLIVEVGQGSSDLIQIVLALEALGRFPSLGDNRDQQ